MNWLYKKETKIVPVMEFESEEQAEALLKEWQDRLFLNDWIIVLKINVPRYAMRNDEEAAWNSFSVENKSSVIRISQHDEDTTSRIIKLCDEETLIHELLHLKYNLLEPNRNYEALFLDVHQHMLLEQMAKSLLMAKYNLPFNWFKNLQEEI